MRIKKTPFICDTLNLNRLKVLIKAWKDKIILAQKICLIEDGAILYLTVVEYGRIEPNKTGLKSLKEFLSSEEPEYTDINTRSQIFFNLLYAVNQIHVLGIPHLMINPERIWIKDNLKVYLLPFDVSAEVHNDPYSVYYTAPKYFLDSVEYHLNYE